MEVLDCEKKICHDRRRVSEFINSAGTIVLIISVVILMTIVIDRIPVYIERRI